MAGPGAIPPPGFNPRGGGGPPPPPSDPVQETVEMALGQAQGATKAIAVYKKFQAKTMQELAGRGSKDIEANRAVTNTISTPETGSLQMTHAGTKIVVAENTCTKMSRKKGGWFFSRKKKGIARQFVEDKASKSKNASITTYYGSRGPAIAKLDVSLGISSAAEAIFIARNEKELASSLKSSLTTAADGVIALADKITPDNAAEIAKLAGTVKGLLGATDIKLDDKKTTGLEALIATTGEFDSAKDVANQTAEKLVNSAKQDATPNYQQAA